MRWVIEMDDSMMEQETSEHFPVELVECMIALLQDMVDMVDRLIKGGAKCGTWRRDGSQRTQNELTEGLEVFD